VTLGGNISKYTAKLLGDFNNPTVGSFFASSNGEVFSQADAKVNSNIIDFVYYHGVSNGPTLAAPSESDAMSIYDNASTGLQTWSNRNDTKFKMLLSFTTSDFDEAWEADNDIAIVDNATDVTSEKANQLEEGDIFAFITEAGKKGLVKVVEITGIPNSDGTITIDVMVQE